MRQTRAELIAVARTHVTAGTGRAIREAARLSQSEIAAEIGVAESTVCRWEARRPERRRLPRGDHAVAYARLLARLHAQSVPAATPRTPS